MSEKTRVRKVLDSCLDEAGKIILKGFGLTHRIKKKAPVSIVTEIDLAADAKIVSLIRRNFPDHHILTEESKPFKGNSDYRWIIDPLDGTTNFSHGIPLCCVSIGVEYKGEIILGGVYNPMLKERFFAEAGKGAFLNGKRIRVSPQATLIDSLLVTGFPYDRQEKAGFYLGYFKALMEKCQGVRRLGAAAVDLAYVACGRFEAFWEFNLQPWDVAAGVLLVKEAGGKVTDFKGEPFDAFKPVQLLSSNGKVHAQILSTIQKVFLK